ncbi:MAG: glycosyltransferase, partial [Lachnospiraceae bacterium]
MSMVSVIMPAYNAGDFISEAIESIIKQSYQNWNLVILNDGSIDNTKSIAEKYTKKYSDKISLINKEKNEGTVSGLNALLKSVNGKYIC